MKKNKVIVSLVTVMLSASTAVYASDAIGPGDKDARWIVGVGAASVTNIYAGEDSESSAFPSFMFNGERLFIKDGSINYSINSWGEMSAGISMTYDASFISFKSEFEDNVKLAGLQERDSTVEAGFYLYHTTDMGRLEFTVLTDVASKHEGQTATIQYIYDLEAAGWNINPIFGVTWASDDKVDHYYGVSSTETTATRLAYKGDASVNVFAGVRGRYDFSDNWYLNIDAGVTRFGSGITKSTIVDEDSAYYGVVALNYSF